MHCWMFILRHGISFTASSIVQGISAHHGGILEVEWEENCCEPHVEMLVPVYHKTDVLALQALLRDKFGIWASNGRCVEEIWNNFKETVSDSIQLLFHVKYLDKPRTRNTTTRNLNDYC